MHPELHRYLDGELDRAALSAEAVAELREWEALNGLVRVHRAERAPSGLVNDVMRALPPVRESWLRRVAGWLVTPRPVRVAPLTPLAIALSALLLIVLAPGDEVVLTDARAPQVVPTVYVQFTLSAADAQSVAVAGDFNNWSADAGVLRDPDGDGVWVGMLAVEPGVHKYMFVVNGQEWVTDPRAEGYVDDGFGMRNALLAVRTPAENAT